MRTADIDRAMKSLNETMKEKLKENDYKGSWTTTGIWELYYLLCEEIDELSKALLYESTEAIKKECADVANFVMFIHDNIGGNK